MEKRIADGDAQAKLIYDGMLYSAARAIGRSGCRPRTDQVDRVILTGGIAHSKYVAAYLTKKLSFIAPVEIMPGEFELEALAAGALPRAGGAGAPEAFCASRRTGMSGNFLPAARKLVFLGEAGCGKSEIAMQLALTLAAQGGTGPFLRSGPDKAPVRARDAAGAAGGGRRHLSFCRSVRRYPHANGGTSPAADG